jgi:DNA-binding beta-propeller fold protein YncE
MGSTWVTSPWGMQPSDVVSDGRNLWVTNFGGNSLTKLDRNGNILLTVLLDTPSSVILDGRDLWVANAGTNENPGSIFAKLDTKGNIRGVFGAATVPLNIFFGDYSIWVTGQGTEDSPNISVFNLSLDGERLGRYGVGIQPRSMVFDGKNLWVANSDITITKLTVSS